MADLTTSLSECNVKMNKAIDVAKEDFAAIRTGRAQPSMFAKLMVDYYGTGTPLSQLATVQVPEARLALVTPYDKGAMAAIEKAIRDSDLGVNPGSDGTVIRVNFPQLTLEMVIYFYYCHLSICIMEFSYMLRQLWHLQWKLPKLHWLLIF